MLRDSTSAQSQVACARVIHSRGIATTSLAMHSVSTACWSVPAGDGCREKATMVAAGVTSLSPSYRCPCPSAATCQHCNPDGVMIAHQH
jgi:hypothetical protein